MDFEDFVDEMEEAMYEALQQAIKEKHDEEKKVCG